VGEVADKKSGAHEKYCHDQAGEAVVAEVAAEAVHKYASKPYISECFYREGVDRVPDQAENPGEWVPEGEAGVGVKRETEIYIRVPDGNIAGVKGGAKEEFIGEILDKRVVFRCEQKRGQGQVGKAGDQGQQEVLRDIVG